MNLEDLRKRWAELNAKYPVGKSRREADPYVKDALTPQLLSVLTPREAKVMRMRYGLEDGSRHTFAEVGQSLSLSRESIRQIEKKVWRKLRHPAHRRLWG